MTNKHYAFVDRTCPRCDGSGEIGGFDGLQTCPECHGTGLVGSYGEVPDIPMNGDKEFGDLLRKTREQCKIGMYELAKEFGWSPVHLSNIETGREQPTETERRQIKEWLG